MRKLSQDRCLRDKGVEILVVDLGQNLADAVLPVVAHFPNQTKGTRGQRFLPDLPEMIAFDYKGLERIELALGAILVNLELCSKRAGEEHSDGCGRANEQYVRESRVLLRQALHLDFCLQLTLLLHNRD